MIALSFPFDKRSASRTYYSAFCKLPDTPCAMYAIADGPRLRSLKKVAVLLAQAGQAGERLS
jgi:hypothetical protein